MRSHLLMVASASLLVGFASRAPEAAVTGKPAPAPVAAVAVTAPVANPGGAAVNNALTELSRHVTKQSDSNALKTAITAYFNFKTAHPEAVKKPYLYYIDYGLSNRAPRGYVFNMETLELVDGPFIVAHGRGSGPKNAVPMRFSNRPGSAATSLGLYVTQETYGFGGHSGGKYYTSIGLRMAGQSGRFNSKARDRGVVVHGAPYVTAAGSGRSEGCPAMEQFRARRLLPMLSGGAVVFQYSPNDADWLNNDPWVNS
ncbi:MAG TPA: murein L,D-transpeptidase catalytic domain family protein [Longimicrobiales bacterium]